MNETAKKDTAAATKCCEIHHPKSGDSIRSTHFIAFGRIDKSVCPCGSLLDEKNNPVARGTGRLILLTPAKRQPKRMFWAVHFSIGALQDGNYKLRIGDENGGELTSVVITLAPSRAASSPTGGGSVTIDYPHQSDNPIPLQFFASGTALATGGDVSGTMSNCDTPPTSITPDDPPPSWTLYCSIANPGTSCTLTVTQGASSDQSGGLTFGTS